MAKSLQSDLAGTERCGNLARRSGPKENEMATKTITEIKQVGEFIYRGKFLKTGNHVACFYSRQNKAGGWTSVAQNARKQRAILDHAFRDVIEELRAAH
jgi:hypothetical protein